MIRLTEDNIADYADTLVERARAGGQFLDYSEASVARLENLIRLSDDALRAPDLPTEHRDLAIFYNGCFLGELMARNLRGAWKFEETWPDSSLIFRRNDGTGIQIRPFHKLFRRVTEPPEANDLVAYYDGLRSQLNDNPPGDT